MKITPILLLVLLFLSTNLFSQFAPSYANLDERRGKILFNFGMEYRVTPFYELSMDIQRNVAGSFTNTDNIHRGPAFSYGLELFLSKKLSFNIQHSFRRSLLVLPFGPIEGGSGIDIAEKELLMGFHASLDYHVKIFSESELFFRFGISTYNGGSNFVVKTAIFNEQNEIVDGLQTQGSYDNEGLNVAFGLAKNQFKLLLGIYTSKGNKFYNLAFPIYTPYVKLSYNILRL